MEFRRGSVFWWNCPEHHRDHIQRGSRPVVIVSNDTCNASSPVVTVVPFTTQVKRAYPQQVPVVFKGEISTALTDQICSVSVSELGGFICYLCDFQMDQIDVAIAIQLGLVDVDSRPYALFSKKNRSD